MLQLKFPFHCVETTGAAAKLYELLGTGCDAKCKVNNAITFLKAAYNHTKRNLAGSEVRMRRAQIADRKRKLEAEMKKLADEEAELEHERQAKKSKATPPPAAKQ